MPCYLPGPLATCLAGLGLLLAAPAAAQQLRLAPLRTGQLPPAPAGPARSFRYVPTAALRRQAVQAVATRLQARSPAEAQLVRATFGPGQADYAPLYAALLRNSGLADNDAAGALALYLEAGYRVVHNITDDDVVTASQEQALRAQAARLLAPTARRRPPAAVAHLGEELKLQSVLLVLAWQTAQKSAATLDFRSTIAQQFRAEYGLDLREVRLTNQGLVPRF
ncbi:MAG: hypothetical protein ACRYFK_13210 [Janthinobacterium lividum]